MPPAEFLSKEKTYALVGASSSWQDHAYYLFLELEKAGFSITPLHPNENEICGVPAFPYLINIPPVDGVIFASKDEEVSLEYLKDMRDTGLYTAWFEEGCTTEEMKNFARIANFQTVQKTGLLEGLRNGDIS